MTTFFDQLRIDYGEATVKINEPMSLHTSFKIGGPAQVLLIPKGPEELRSLLEQITLADVPYMIMGNGSNLLVPDVGIKGAVVKLCEGFKKSRVEGGFIVAEAGCLLSSLSNLALDASLTGLEFASGIPGTLGGAVFMNAGAYGGEMQHIVSSVTVLDKTGQMLTLKRSELEFGYRWSSIQDKGYIVIEATLNLSIGDLEEMKKKLKELTEKRTSKQPLELPSAGSVFKRPVGFFAGQLIEEAGLRGLRHGDAQVSTKHCGFIVNLGKSNYEEVTKLIRTVQKIVYDQFGVRLETEIHILKSFI